MLELVPLARSGSDPQSHNRSFLTDVAERCRNVSGTTQPKRALMDQESFTIGPS